MAVIKVSDTVWGKFKEYSVGRDTADTLLRRVIEGYERSAEVEMEKLIASRRELLNGLFDRDDVSADEKVEFLESIAAKEGKIKRVMDERKEELSTLRKELRDELQRLGERLLQNRGASPRGS